MISYLRYLYCQDKIKTKLEIKQNGLLLKCLFRTVCCEIHCKTTEALRLTPRVGHSDISQGILIRLSGDQISEK